MPFFGCTVFWLYLIGAVLQIGLFFSLYGFYLLCLVFCVLPICVLVENDGVVYGNGSSTIICLLRRASCFWLQNLALSCNLRELTGDPKK